LGVVIAQSKITELGQISVLAEVCKKLGLGPGLILAGDEVGATFVRRSGKFSSEDTSRVLSPYGPLKQISINAMKKTIAEQFKEHNLA
jgi:bifunctional DNA-binding transcriptional regulator/antitoxin component of YhaV-PrlF toxin-antitoxin module